MDSRYINKKFIIVVAIIGAIIPLGFGIGFSDFSPIPHSLSFLIWGVPGSLAALLLGGGGVFGSFLGPAGFFVWIGVSSLYYVIVLSSIRILVIFLTTRFKEGSKKTRTIIGALLLLLVAFVVSITAYITTAYERDYSVQIQMDEPVLHMDIITKRYTYPVPLSFLNDAYRADVDLILNRPDWKHPLGVLGVTERGDRVFVEIDIRTISGLFSSDQRQVRGDILNERTSNVVGHITISRVTYVNPHHRLRHTEEIDPHGL